MKTQKPFLRTATLAQFINFTLLIFNSGGQVQTVDISNPQTVEGTAITGDTPYTAFDKVNLSLLYLGLLASNNVTALTTVSNTANEFAPALAFQGSVRLLVQEYSPSCCFGAYQK